MKAGQGEACGPRSLIDRSAEVRGAARARGPSRIADEKAGNAALATSPAQIFFRFFFFFSFYDSVGPTGL